MDAHRARGALLIDKEIARTFSTRGRETEPVSRLLAVQGQLLGYGTAQPNDTSGILKRNKYEEARELWQS